MLEEMKADYCRDQDQGHPQNLLRSSCLKAYPFQNSMKIHTSNQFAILVGLLEMFLLFSICLRLFLSSLYMSVLL